MMLRGKTLRPKISILSVLLLLAEMMSLMFEFASCRHFYSESQRSKYDYFNDNLAFAVRFSTGIR